MYGQLFTPTYAREKLLFVSKVIQYRQKQVESDASLLNTAGSSQLPLEWYEDYSIQVSGLVDYWLLRLID